MPRSSLSSSSSKVAPSVEGQNQNKVNAVGDHAQANPTAHSVQGQRGGQVADDIETADIEQGITGHRSNASFRRISRAKTFVAEKKYANRLKGMDSLCSSLST